MNDVKYKPGCQFAEDSVRYIYGEMSRAEVEPFEQHLGVCDICIGELAAISHARFDVYEWRKEAFSPLSTPSIVVPVEGSKIVRYGLFDRIRAAVVFVPTWAYTGGVAVVVLGLMLLIWQAGRMSPDLAVLPHDVSVNEPPVQILETSLSEPFSDQAVEPDTTKNVPANVSANRGRASSNSLKVVALKPYERFGPAARKPERSQTAVTARQTLPLRLNDFSEDEDRSLRLAELLDDIGSGK